MALSHYTNPYHDTNLQEDVLEYRDVGTKTHGLGLISIQISAILLVGKSTVPKNLSEQDLTLQISSCVAKYLYTIFED